MSNAGSLKSLKRRRPDAIVGVVGCAAQNLKDGIFDRLPHVQLIVGPRRFGAIPRLVEEIRRTGLRRIAVEDCDDEFIDGAEVDSARETPFKAFVKAMEGCDLSCTFCIVPTTRGGRSESPESIVEEVRQTRGFGRRRRSTLLGQTVDSYGRGSEARDRLGRPDPARARSSRDPAHPVHHVAPVVHARADHRALREAPQRRCKYVHMPAQSGSDAVLKRMRRGYTVARYLSLVDRLRERVPGVEIASDFIVGFPGETAEDFEATLELSRRVRFQNAFVFQYSPRPGTDAADMPDDVPDDEKGRRNRELLALQEGISREKNAGRVGQRLEILVDGPSKNNPRRQAGRTDTNQIVHFEAERDLRGKFVEVDIASSTPLTLFGRLT
jgi:tRNA-2-methylthio-N6-dimethylallyladenosine synthase